MQKRLGTLFLLTLGLGLASWALLSRVSPVIASPIRAPSAQRDVPDSEACLFCHRQPGITRALPNGDILPLTIDPVLFEASAHNVIECSDCHTNITSTPHPEFNPQSRRDASLQLYTVCQGCHEEQYNETLDSVHLRALAGGNENAAICTDCHNPHTQIRLTTGEGENKTLLPEARLHIPETCARCHSLIYDTYESSIHGAALTEEENTDVPTCIDCHGVHNIPDPTTDAFRLDSPQICAKCHTDASIMEKYGISTQVLNTYVSDFHGTTVTLFESITPDQPTNKPVCYDCHGIHDIKRTDDPVYGLQMKENLLVRCQQCHPESSTSFPDAWMGHYVPSPDSYPIVYFVNLFYKFFIPAVLIPMIVFVISDIVRRLIERRKGAKHV